MFGRKTPLKFQFECELAKNPMNFIKQARYPWKEDKELGILPPSMPKMVVEQRTKRSFSIAKTVACGLPSHRLATRGALRLAGDHFDGKESWSMRFVMRRRRRARWIGLGL